MVRGHIRTRAKVNEISPETFARVLVEKQDINIARKWPPPGPVDKAVEHIKE